MWQQPCTPHCAGSYDRGAVRSKGSKLRSQMEYSMSYAIAHLHIVLHINALARLLWRLSRLSWLGGSAGRVSHVDSACYTASDTRDVELTKCPRVYSVSYSSNEGVNCCDLACREASRFEADLTVADASAK